LSRPAPALAWALLLALCGCADPEAPPPPKTRAGSAAPWFVESAAARGLGFVHESGASGRYYLPEIMAGGAALFDMDGDGDLDAYLVQSGFLEPGTIAQPGNRLYRNEGGGIFADATEGSGADDRGYGMGVAAGDYDNDGDVDLYVTNVGPNRLLANDGTGRFTDVTAAAGVGDPGWGTSAAFLDYDRDGDLDLYVCNYLLWSVATNVECYSHAFGLDYCSPQAIDRPVPDVLFRNEGDGTFTDRSAESGIGSALGTGLGIVCGDFDGDAWPDVFVANDGMDDRLWINRRDGSFEDLAFMAGCAVDEGGAPKAGMGVAAADLDGDGTEDLIVCNLAGQTDSAYLNDGSGLFRDVTARLGLAAVSRPFTRFGMGLVDLDNDGRLDLYQANGRVIRQEREWDADPYAEPNLLFRGRRDGTFEELSPRGGTIGSLAFTSRAAAFGDVDGDGGIDVLVVNRDAPAHLLINAVPRRRRWLALEVLQEHGSDAIGARVSGWAGDTLVVREVRAAHSYLASSDPRVHVGLGDQTLLRDVTVRWIDGTQEAFGDLEADRVVTLRRGEGRPVVAP
jgi:hypothetical protein